VTKEGNKVALDWPLLLGAIQIATSQHCPNFNSLRQQKKKLLSIALQENFLHKNKSANRQWIAVTF
jgi:hypothetical protein